MVEYKVVTTHIRQMLTDACDKACAAEIEDEFNTVETKAVLLKAAAVEARHAAAELETELFQLLYPNVKIF